MSTGLKHYKNSKISMNNFEPVYLNLFHVLITPPPTVDKWDYVLEEIQSVSGLTTDQTPGALIEQTYKGAKRRFSAPLPESTTVDIAINFHVNVDDNLSMIAYKGLRKWCNLIWQPLTGAMTLKKDYIGGPMNVFLTTRDEQVLRQWVFPVVWPITSIQEMGFSYDSTEAYAMDMTFAADYWDDMTY